MLSLLSKKTRSLSDVLRRLGGISPDRIGLPVGCATEEDVIRHLDGADKRMYELIDGVLVEKDMGMKESRIAVNVTRHLDIYLDDHDLGFTFGADGPTRLRIGRIRFPDTGFVSWSRITDDAMLEDAILDAVPNLAVEVISKGNTKEEMDQKLKDYFKAGVELVWYIYPKTATADIFASPTSKKTIDENGILDGGNVLPGFRLPLRKALTLHTPPKKHRSNGNGRPSS